MRESDPEPTSHWNGPTKRVAGSCVVVVVVVIMVVGVAERDGDNGLMVTSSPSFTCAGRENSLRASW